MRSFFNEITDKDKDKAAELLISSSSPRHSYYVMVGLSVAMATMGLLINSSAVVIGSMLIAPVLYPILSLAMGITISDRQLTSRSFFTLGRSIFLAIIISVGISIIFSSLQPEITNEIIGRTAPNILHFAIALVAGLAVTFAMVKPNMNEALPGVAISASLVPPLAVVGIGIARLNIAIASSAFILFSINIIGIMFSAIILFSLMEFITEKKVIRDEIIKDNKIVIAESEKE